MPRGVRRLPDSCIRRLEAADLILHAGDFVAPSVLEGLRAFAPVEGVLGNMDAAELAAELPDRRVVEVEGVRIGMIHNAGPAGGRPQRLAGAFPGCAAVVYGHTHLPEAREIDGLWVVNPGSPTERRSSPHHSMAELEVVGADLTVRTHVL